jgi:hypothetical protein
VDKLQNIIDFLKVHEGYDKNEVVTDLLAKAKATGRYSADEIGVEWDGENLTDLESFAYEFYDLVIEAVCNVVESYKND